MSKWKLNDFNKEFTPCLERDTNGYGYAAIEILEADLYIDHEVPGYGTVSIMVPVEMVKRLLEAHEEYKENNETRIY